MADAGGGLVTDIVSGRIEIDVSQMRATRDVVVRAAQEMEKAMKVFGASTDQSANQATSALGRINQAIRDNEKQIGGLALAVTGFGVTSARSVSRIQDQFRILVGDERKAADWMDQIRQAADDTNQAFLPMLEGATTLVPIMRQGNAEFSTMLGLVNQLSSANPEQGASGATFGLREAFAGQYRSLVNRFNLSASEVSDIFKQNEGDMQGAAEALSAYLDELGYSQDALVEFGAQGHNTFAILRSEAQETAAKFFDPFNDGINQALGGFADLLRGVRNVDDELAGVIGTMTALVGLTQAASLANMIPGAGAVPGLGTGLGYVSKAAGFGLAAYGGAQLGVFATRQLANAGLGGGFEQYQGQSQSEVMGQLTETMGQALGILVIGTAEFVKLLIDVADKVEEPVDKVIDQLDKLNDAFADGVQWWKDQLPGKSTGEKVTNAALGPLLSIIPGGGVIKEAYKAAKDAQNVEFPANAPGMGTHRSVYGPAPAPNIMQMMHGDPNVGIEALARRTSALGTTAESTAQSVEQEKSAADKAKESVDDFTKGLLVSLGIIDKGPQSLTNLGNSLNEFTGIFDALGQAVDYAKQQVRGPDFSQEQIDAFSVFQEEMAAIEAEYQTKREEQAQQYEERRLELEDSYQQQVAQTIENEGIRQERAAESLARSIGQVQERLAEQLASIEEDHQKRLEDMRESYQEAEIQARKDLHNRLEDLEKSYRDRILNAAANFDGWAIIQAKDAYQQQQQEAVDNYRDDKDKRREQYDERLQEEQDAYEGRLQAARDNADQQIRNLQDNFDYQERLRAQNYQRQLRQMAEAHQRELASLESKYRQSQQKLNAAEAAELASREQAFRQQLNSLMAHENDMLAIQKTGQDEMEKALRDWYMRQVEMFGTVGSTTSTTTGTTTGGGGTGGNRSGATGGTMLEQYASGGPLTRSGAFGGSAGEYVLNQQTTRAISDMLGQNFTQPALLGALAGGGGGGDTISIQFDQHITGGGAGIDNAMLNRIRDVTTDVFMEVMQTVQSKRGKN